MRKILVLVIAVALPLNIASTVLANNPFSDVSQGHWAYEAIAKLEKDGLITGYGDGTYRGDRVMSRYEMATVVAQLDDVNSENAEMVNRLRSEFATELYNLGVRVDKLEKNASSIKFSGVTGVRYLKNTGSVHLTSIKGQDPNTHKFDQRVRLDMDANINEKVKFKGAVNYTNTSNFKHIGGDPGVSWSRDVWLDRAEIQLANGSFEGRFGRINPIIGQGLIWYGNPADGALVGYKNNKWDIFGGVLDYSPTRRFNMEGNGDGNAGESLNATVFNIGRIINNRIHLTAAYSHGHGTAIDGLDYEIMGFGANAILNKHWKVYAEYVKNNSDMADKVKDEWGSDNDGYWFRAQYRQADMNKKGSYSIYAEYMNFGGTVLDSQTYGYGLDVTGGSYFLDKSLYYGFKGYGIGITYVVAKHANVQFIFHDLKTDQGGLDYRNSYQIITNFII
ncbi:S-layer homology domain-containing protein [Selenomonadales bacterium OttesenSCG-928-I06]|nr:S-layer homology domain-containing protein [Selenomonadales bacterium OttesenSCG-928-I06]